MSGYHDRDTKPPRFVRTQQLAKAVKDTMIQLIDENIYPTYTEVCKRLGNNNKSIMAIMSAIFDADELEMPEEMYKKRLKVTGANKTTEKKQLTYAKLWALRGKVLRKYKNDYREIFGTTVLGPLALEHLLLPEDGSSADILYLWFSSWNYIILQRIYSDEQAQIYKDEEIDLLDDTDDEAKFSSFLTAVRKEVKA